MCNFAAALRLFLQALKMLAAVAVREQSSSNHQQQRQQRQHHTAATSGRAGVSSSSSTAPSTADLIDLAAQQQVAALGALVAVLLQVQVNRCSMCIKYS
jgi:hypothetical protein